MKGLGNSEAGKRMKNGRRRAKGPSPSASSRAHRTALESNSVTASRDLTKGTW